MPRSPLPARPRLADHVSPRRHRARNEDFWVLHDEHSGAAYKLGTREWSLIEHADGTRDIEGIIAAAARDGTYARVPALQEFLEALHEADLLSDGVASVVAHVEPSRSLPLDPLPNFRLACDGSGGCCRLYSTIMFRPLEQAVSRSLLPHVFDAGNHPERAFAPLSGSTPCGATSVGFVDGRCAYLGSERRCGLHAAGGSRGKPLGCRTFPAVFVDDGQAVRVTPAVECACVLASVRMPHEGEPLVAEHATTTNELDEGVHIARLPEMILVTAKRYCTRRDLVAWSRVVALSPPPIDTVGVFIALAAEVEAWGLDTQAAERALSAPRPADPDAMRSSLFTLVERARRRMNIDATWRSDSDLARRAVRWIHDAATALVEDPAALPAILAAPAFAIDSVSEAFYLRAGAYGHQFVLGDAPLSLALRDRAARLVLARALPLVVHSDERASEAVLRYPLALVEATLRGHGLLSRDGLL